MGQLRIDDVEVEVRPALEPWPVLGEEPTGATVSRYVDSSLERLQVVANIFDGSIPSRFTAAGLEANYVV